MNRRKCTNAGHEKERHDQAKPQNRPGVVATVTVVGQIKIVDERFHKEGCGAYRGTEEQLQDARCYDLEPERSPESIANASPRLGESPIKTQPKARDLVCGVNGRQISSPELPLRAQAEQGRQGLEQEIVARHFQQKTRTTAGQAYLLSSRERVPPGPDGGS